MRTRSNPIAYTCCRLQVTHIPEALGSRAGAYHAKGRDAEAARHARFWHAWCLDMRLCWLTALSAKTHLATAVEIKKNAGDQSRQARSSNGC